MAAPAASVASGAPAYELNTNIYNKLQYLTNPYSTSLSVCDSLELFA